MALAIHTDYPFGVVDAEFRPLVNAYNAVSEITRKLGKVLDMSFSMNPKHTAPTENRVGGMALYAILGFSLGKLRFVCEYLVVEEHNDRPVTLDESHLNALKDILLELEVGFDYADDIITDDEKKSLEHAKLEIQKFLNSQEEPDELEPEESTETPRLSEDQQSLIDNFKPSQPFDLYSPNVRFAVVECAGTGQPSRLVTLKLIEELKAAEQKVGIADYVLNAVQRTWPLDNELSESSIAFIALTAHIKRCAYIAEHSLETGYIYNDNVAEALLSELRDVNTQLNQLNRLCTYADPALQQKPDDILLGVCGALLRDVDLETSYCRYLVDLTKRYNHLPKRLGTTQEDKEAEEACFDARFRSLTGYQVCLADEAVNAIGLITYMDRIFSGIWDYLTASGKLKNDDLNIVHLNRIRECYEQIQQFSKKLRISMNSNTLKPHETSGIIVDLICSIEAYKRALAKFAGMTGVEPEPICSLIRMAGHIQAKLSVLSSNIMTDAINWA